MVFKRSIELCNINHSDCLSQRPRFVSRRFALVPKSSYGNLGVTDVYAEAGRCVACVVSDVYGYTCNFGFACVFVPLRNKCSFSSAASGRLQASGDGDSWRFH